MLTLTNMNNSNLDVSNLSRTVVIRCINESVTLSELLDTIEYGPIEYVKMVLKPTPPSILQQDPDCSKTLKVCFISFINCKVALQFQNKFVKNLENFNHLKSKLCSKHLKIQMNEVSNSNNNQDYIKLKTLNYIVELGATRCIKLKLLFDTIDEEYSLLTSLSSVDLAGDAKIIGPCQELDVPPTRLLEECLPETPASPTEQTPPLSESISSGSLPDDILRSSPAKLIQQVSNNDDHDEELVLTKEDLYLNDHTLNINAEDTSSPLLTIKTFILNQCSKFGDIEHFKLSLNKKSGSAFIHFTSIDSAIKSFEYYHRRVLNDRQHLEEGNKRRSKLRYDINFSYVNFAKDRCDKTSTSSRGSKSSNSSTKKKPSTSEILSLGLDDMDKDVFSPPDSPLLSTSSSPPQKHFNRSFSYPNFDTSGNGSINGSVNGSLNGYMDGYSTYGGHPGYHGPMAGRQVYQRHLAPHSAPHLHPHMPPTQPFHLGNGYPNSFGLGGDTMNANVAAAAAAANVAANVAAAAAAAANFQVGPDALNVNNRTIYLGNLHPNTTVEEIANNVRAGGLVESIKYHPDKRVCFFTFVDPMVALKFYMNHQVLHQLIVHGYDVTVGWAKNHSGPLTREIGLAVTAGASRNVYIGIKLIRDQIPEQKMTLPTEDELRRDFGQFGELEQINFYHNKDCGFLNFLNIIDAIRVVETFEMDEETGRMRLAKLISNSDAFYDKYSKFKISFAKDRCGNPPKFSFKKKMANVPGTTYQQYQHLLHNDTSRRRNRRPYNEEYDEETRISENQSFMEDTINEEAAMVFGIISNNAKSEAKEETSEEEKQPEESSNSEFNNKEEDSTEDNDESIDSDEVKTEKIGGEPVPDGQEDLEDNDEDEISIIIDAGENTLTDDCKENHDSRRHEKPPRKNNRKGSQSRFGSSDSFVPLRKSSRSSNGSVHYGRAQPHSLPFAMPQYATSSPYIPQLPVYYVPSQRPPIYSSNSQNSFFNNGYMNGNYANSGYPPHSYGYRSGYYTPTSPYPPQPPSPQFYHHRLQQTPKNVNASSGSQVMAQYLAKSQHDNMLYAASIMEHSGNIGEDHDYYMENYARRDRGNSFEGRVYRAKR